MSKNRITLISVLVIMASFISCKWKHHQTVHNIPFETIQFQIQGNDTLSVYGQLEEETLIDGYPCSANWVKLSKNFHVQDFCLSKDYNVSNVQLNKGTWVSLSDSGITCVLPENTLIQNIMCKGGGGKKGIQTSFYSSGKLKTFFTDNDVEINKILCKGGVLTPITLHKNGVLQRCKLVKRQTIQGKTYPKNEMLIFDADSNIMKTKY